MDLTSCPFSSHQLGIKLETINPPQLKWSRALSTSSTSVPISFSLLSALGSFLAHKPLSKATSPTETRLVLLHETFDPQPLPPLPPPPEPRPKLSGDNKELLLANSKDCSDVRHGRHNSSNSSNNNTGLELACYLRFR